VQRELAPPSRYNLIPPDYGGVFGIGETLTYSAQRLLTSGHSMAREFQRSDISKAPVVNGPAPKDEAFEPWQRVALRTGACRSKD